MAAAGNGSGGPWLGDGSGDEAGLGMLGPVVMAIASPAKLTVKTVAAEGLGQAPPGA